MTFFKKTPQEQQPNNEPVVETIIATTAPASDTPEEVQVPVTSPTPSKSLFQGKKQTNTIEPTSLESETPEEAASTPQTTVYTTTPEIVSSTKPSTPEVSERPVVGSLIKPPPIPEDNRPKHNGETLRTQIEDQSYSIPSTMMGENTKEETSKAGSRRFGKNKKAEVAENTDSEVTQPQEAKHRFSLPKRQIAVKEEVPEGPERIVKGKTNKALAYGLPIAGLLALGCGYLAYNALQPKAEEPDNSRQIPIDTTPTRPTRTPARPVTSEDTSGLPDAPQTNTSTPPQNVTPQSLPVRNPNPLPSTAVKNTAVATHIAEKTKNNIKNTLRPSSTSTPTPGKTQTSAKTVAKAVPATKTTSEVGNPFKAEIADKASSSNNGNYQPSTKASTIPKPTISSAKAAIRPPQIEISTPTSQINLPSTPVVNLPSTPVVNLPPATHNAIPHTTAKNNTKKHSISGVTITPPANPIIINPSVHVPVSSEVHLPSSTPAPVILDSPIKIVPPKVITNPSNTANQPQRQITPQESPLATWIHENNVSYGGLASSDAASYAILQTRYGDATVQVGEIIPGTSIKVTQANDSKITLTEGKAKQSIQITTGEGK